MRKFKFRLNTLLRLRELTRDERRGQLAEAYQADEIIADSQHKIQRELDDIQTRGRRAVAPGAIDIDRLLESQRYEVVLGAQKKHASEQRQKVREEIQRRTDFLVEANRQVRVLEELREKQLQRHRQEQDRQEVKLLDEVAGRPKPVEHEA